MRVALSDIYIGPRQRKDYGKSELEELVGDLREHGQIQPIALRPPGDDDKAQPDYSGQPWVLIAGGRRFSAAALLGWDEIEAYAREEMEPLLAQVLELHENLRRKSLSSIEEVQAKAKIAELRRTENPELKDWQIANSIGDDIATFSRDIKAAEYIEKYPHLKKAGTKKAVLRHGKLLDEGIAQQKRAEAAKALTLPDSVPPLEERVVCADALAWLQERPSASADLILIDGPYGYDYWKQGQKNSKEELSNYDDSAKGAADLYEQAIPELARIGRTTGWLVAFCGKETYNLIERLLSNYCAEHMAYREDSRCTNAGKGSCRFLRPNPFPWIWHRPNSRNKPRLPHLHVQNTTELILVCNLGRARLVQTGLSNLLTHDAEYGSERIHANQKPPELYRDLISRFTFAGDTVVDCFFGSGNSLAAAAGLGRIPWGCDSNPTMLPHALGRIRAAQVIITETMISASYDRYQEALLRTFEDAPPEEVEALRAEGKSWEWSVVGKIDDSYLGYIIYDGHNLGQLRDTVEDRLDQRLAEACTQLSESTLDPQVCTPEQVQTFLREKQL